ncbi:MAG: hypothetical protein FVQ79_00650 [Planctomycetes bacterium]|nr:hypothetical protein [Planctomycetota bacterium]
MPNKVSQLPLSGSYTVEQALNVALNRGLQEVIIIGFDKEGDEFCVSSKMLRRDANWLIDCAKEHNMYGN